MRWSFYWQICVKRSRSWVTGQGIWYENRLFLRQNSLKMGTCLLISQQPVNAILPSFICEMIFLTAEYVLEDEGHRSKVKVTWHEILVFNSHFSCLGPNISNQSRQSYQICNVIWSFSPKTTLLTKINKCRENWVISQRSRSQGVKTFILVHTEVIMGMPVSLLFWSVVLSSPIWWTILDVSKESNAC